MGESANLSIHGDRETAALQDEKESVTDSRAAVFRDDPATVLACWTCAFSLMCVGSGGRLCGYYCDHTMCLCAVRSFICAKDTNGLPARYCGVSALYIVFQSCLCHISVHHMLPISSPWPALQRPPRFWVMTDSSIASSDCRHKVRDRTGTHHKPIGQLIECKSLVSISLLHLRREVVAHDRVIIRFLELNCALPFWQKSLSGIACDGEFVSKAEHVAKLVLEDVLQDRHTIWVESSLEDDNVLVDFVGEECSGEGVASGSCGGVERVD